MTEADAVRHAEQARTAHGVPSDAKLALRELRYIELATEDSKGLVRVRDLLAWVIRFEFGPSFIELALDDATGAVVRVERSR